MSAQWEQRMAENAAARATVREAEDIAEWAVECAEREAEAAPFNEAAVLAAMENMTPEDVLEAQAEGRTWACACVGGPPGCSLCFCHIHAEAEARVLGEPCPWFSHRA